MSQVKCLIDGLEMREEKKRGTNEKKLSRALCDEEINPRGASMHLRQPPTGWCFSATEKARFWESFSLALQWPGELRYHRENIVRDNARVIPEEEAD